MPLHPDSPRHVSIIQSQNFFVEFKAKKFIKDNSAPGFVMNVFRGIEEASAWLKAQPSGSVPGASKIAV
ncbi:MAG: hypothetical protein AAFQ98_23895 [Bacteroidota bacterium]